MNCMLNFRRPTNKRNNSHLIGDKTSNIMNNNWQKEEMKLQNKFNPHLELMSYKFDSECQFQESPNFEDSSSAAKSSNYTSTWMPFTEINSNKNSTISTSAKVFPNSASMTKKTTQLVKCLRAQIDKTSLSDNYDWISLFYWIKISIQHI